MNLAEIMAEINKDIDDELENEVLIGWINRCMDDLSPDARYQKLQTITFSEGVNTAELPSDLSKIVQVVENNEPLKELTLGDFKHSGYKVYADTLILQPGSETARSVDLYYEGNLPHLANVEDVPVIHPSFHDLFVLYTVARFMFQDDETYRKGDVFKDYLARKSDFVRFVNRASIGPIKDVYGYYG